MCNFGESLSYSSEGEGLFARAVCHELAHLDGQLFIDVMTEEIFEDEEPYDDEGMVTE